MVHENKCGFWLLPCSWFDLFSYNNLYIHFLGSFCNYVFKYSYKILQIDRRCAKYLDRRFLSLHNSLLRLGALMFPPILHTHIKNSERLNNLLRSCSSEKMELELKPSLMIQSTFTFLILLFHCDFKIVFNWIWYVSISMEKSTRFIIFY